MFTYNIYPWLFIGAIIYFFLSAYLGSARKFYDKYSWWDRLVHFLSGFLYVSFGVALSGIKVGLNAFDIALFSFTFSVTIHVFWEIIEYTTDCIKKSNHQRWQKKHDSINHQAKDALQPAGLVDTMNDTIMCVIGSALASTIWGVFLTVWL